MNAIKLLKYQKNKSSQASCGHGQKEGATVERAEGVGEWTGKLIPNVEIDGQAIQWEQFLMM